MSYSKCCAIYCSEIVIELKGYAYWTSEIWGSLSSFQEFTMNPHTNGSGPLMGNLSTRAHCHLTIYCCKERIKNQRKSVFFQIISQFILPLIIAQVMATVSYVSAHFHSPFESYNFSINSFTLLLEKGIKY